LPISSANGITGTWSPALNNAATTLYTFTPTAGLCATTATMTITINPIHTIALSSATATETQSLCVSTALSPITYTLGGGATGANVTGLPTGVTASVAGTTLTISGTPSTTTGSPFTYAITTTGNNCTVATDGGTITINPIQTIVLTSVTTSENQTLCINTAITPITYTLGGGATGANVTGLPAGVTATVAGTTLTISGTPISTAGSPYVFNITTTGSICLVATDSGTMIVNPIPVLNPISNQDYCPSVLVPASNWITVPPGSTYVWTNSTTTIGLAASGFGSAPSFTSANSTTTQQIATIDITPTLNGCVGSVASYTITVNPTLTPQFTFGTLVQLCEGSTPPALPLSTTNTPPISGSWSPSSISSTASGNYVFTPSPGLCVVPATLQVLLSPLPVVSLPQDGIVCVTQAGVLVSSYTLDTQLNPSQYSFVWSTSTGVLPAETNPSLLVPAAGTYSVQVTNTSSLCSNSATAVVGSIVTPESATISYSAFFSSEQVVTVNVVPAGDYLYQLDNGPFQSSNYFYNIPTGDHTITVKNECAELAPIPFRIVDYPKFFTPNNDGFNDLWNVFDLADQPDATIYLFDRYGKLLKQMSTVGDGWDGTYNSAEMPSTDYWFKINYKENGQFKEFKSHFSLKR
jgi:gliding motility-associated-like protein